MQQYGNQSLAVAHPLFRGFLGGNQASAFRHLGLGQRLGQAILGNHEWPQDGHWYLVRRFF